MKRTEIYDRQLFIELCCWYKKLSQRIDRCIENTPIERKDDGYFIQSSVLMDERNRLHKRILKAIPKDYNKSKWYFAMYDEIILSKCPTL